MFNSKVENKWHYCKLLYEKKYTKFSKTEVLKKHSRFDIRLLLNKMQIYYVSKLLLINISEPTTQALNYIDLNSAACHL